MFLLKPIQPNFQAFLAKVKVIIVDSLKAVCSMGEALPFAVLNFIRE